MPQNYQIKNIYIWGFPDCDLQILVSIFLTLTDISNEQHARKYLQDQIICFL